MANQVQCANCYCTLYTVQEGRGGWGITGELCDCCQKKQQEEDDYYYYDDDD
ncbi:hypothetical protein [Methylophaga sp.]|uniref:hypothetical protein n=1 Tax=Methylophaga sp. TaxID=2024840 RepID=UPI003A903762